jgi:hypothetical protein
MRRLTLALGIIVAAAVSGLAATSASATAYGNLSFFSGGGGSAAWSGTPNKHSAVQLVAPSGGEAGIQLNRISTTAPADAPTFTTDNYAAGSPRLIMFFAGGAHLFGYPSQFGSQWEVAGCDSVAAGTYTDYATALGKLQGGTQSDGTTSCGGDVIGVDLVADDSSGATSETDSITSLVYDGTAYIG